MFVQVTFVTVTQPVQIHGNILPHSLSFKHLGKKRVIAKICKKDCQKYIYVFIVYFLPEVALEKM